MLFWRLIIDYILYLLHVYFLRFQCFSSILYSFIWFLIQSSYTMCRNKKYLHAVWEIYINIDNNHKELMPWSVMLQWNFALENNWNFNNFFTIKLTTKNWLQLPLFPMIYLKKKKEICFSCNIYTITWNFHIFHMTRGGGGSFYEFCEEL